MLNDTLAREWAGQWMGVHAWVLAGNDQASGEQGPGWWSTSSRKAGRSLVRDAGRTHGGVEPLVARCPMNSACRMIFSQGDKVVSMIWVPDSQDPFWLHELRLERLYF